MKMLLALGLCLPVLGWGVQTKNCPQNLLLSYEGIDPLSDQALARVGADHVDFERLKEERDQLKDLAASSYENLKFRLVEKVQSQCRYLLEGEDEQKGDNETRLITRNGRDILRVALTVGDYHYWSYHTVTKMSVSGLELAPSKASRLLGDFDHGGASTQVGWARGLSVSVPAQESFFVELPQTDKQLVKKTDAINSRWADDNISTGTTRIAAEALADQRALADLEKLSLSNYHELFEYFVEEKVPADTKITTSVKEWSKEEIKKVAKIVALGNAYSPENTESVNTFVRQLNSLVKLLGPQSGVKIMTSKASLANNGDEEEMREVSSVLILHTSTKRALRIFVIEGTM